MGTRYVLTTLKKKAGRSPLETGADTGTQAMEEEDIVDGSELATSLTLRKKRGRQ